MIPMKPASREAVRKAYANETRFNALCQSIVAEEMDRAGRALDDAERHPGYVREVCHRIATGVAARVLQTVYENDHEIAEWKAEAERLQALALDLAHGLTPPPLILKTPP